LSPEKRTGQGHRLQNSSKTSLEEKKGLRESSAREKWWALPGGTEALISLFKDQLISCKAGKILEVLREGLG
jgi:hypothetical protein